MLLCLKEAKRRPSAAGRLFGLYALLLCWLWIWSFKAQTSREVAGTEWLLASMDHDSEHDCLSIAVSWRGSKRGLVYIFTVSSTTFFMTREIRFRNTGPRYLCRFFPPCIFEEGRESPTECPLSRACFDSVIIWHIKFSSCNLPFT